MINKTLILISIIISLLAVSYKDASAATTIKNKSNAPAPVNSAVVYVLIVGTVGSVFFFNRNKLSGKSS